MNRLITALLLLWTASSLRAPAQTSEADRKVFAQVKAKAEKGEVDAQLTLASLYADGVGVSRDLGKAAKWHRKAAEQGSPEAEYQVGMDYAEGAGVKMDKAEATHWFFRAAEQGFTDAELSLGLCYANGEGVHQTGTEAVRWFHKAADNGSASAKYELGNCYLEGTGVTKDITEGVKWFRRAAEAGFAPAQNALATCYDRGTGVNKDQVEAYKWFALAAANDDAHAADIRVSLARLEVYLTKEQVSEAQGLARDFKPSQKSSSSTAPPKDSPSKFSDLPATPAKGTLNLKADDDNSEVFVDGTFFGNPPAKLQLAEGVHEIIVKRSGFKDYRKEIKITSGADLNLRAALNKE